jgi:hypothetical protein
LIRTSSLATLFMAPMQAKIASCSDLPSAGAALAAATHAWRCANG